MCSRFADRSRFPLATALLFAASSLAAQTQQVAAKTPASTVAAPAIDNRSSTDSAGKDSRAARERVKPNGPVTVTASNVDWAKNGMMVYTGNVKFDSDTLRIDGDRLELEQLGGGRYNARVSGAPAHLLHQAAVDDQGQPQPEVTARGKTVTYNSQTGEVDVNGDSRITRGNDEITGETIHYNVNERRIQAAGGNGGQVKIVIVPQDGDVKSPPAGVAPDPKAPAPAP